MQLRQQVYQLSTLRISFVQLHVLNSFCQVALWWVLKVEVGEQVWEAVLDILNNTFIILIQGKQLAAKTSIWLKSGAEIASSSYSDILSNMNLKYPLTQQVQSLPSSTKRIVLAVEVALIVNTNILYCLHLDIWCQFRFLGNCPLYYRSPMPTLCPKRELSVNINLGEG